MRTFFILYATCLLMMGVSCKTEEKIVDSKMLIDAELLHENVKQLTDVIIHDVFSPPVSSRIYSYTTLAAYEAIRFDNPENSSIVEQLHGFSKMPAPEKDKQYNFILAATKAFFTVAKKITFSKDSLIQYENKIYPKFQNLLGTETFQNSIQFGEAIGNAILERTAKDNYKETRGMPKFIGSDEEGKWRPTPPDYLDAAEPHWGKMMPFIDHTETQFKCPLPQVYDTSRNSKFFKEVMEVYSIGRNLSEEEKTIAKYWDDNPFVMEHSGHMMFGNKKVTPVGHWISITGIACKINNADPVVAAKAYALASVAMYEVIIACWDSKFEYQTIRPVTVINELIDPNWQPFLQTPPFPEHSSGHSGISAAAATVLTKMFGDNIAFEDTSELEYIGLKRSFPSFMNAANEAAISRIYGGIHYRTGAEAGAVQGKEVGEYVSNKFLKNR